MFLASCGQISCSWWFRGSPPVGVLKRGTPPVKSTDLINNLH